jgi:hypothetical protein
MAPKVPTLYVWLGGNQVLTRHIDCFCQKVHAEDAKA